MCPSHSNMYSNLIYLIYVFNKNVFYVSVFRLNGFKCERIKTEQITLANEYMTVGVDPSSGSLQVIRIFYKSTNRWLMLL
jgi:hypothetical protein